MTETVAVLDASALMALLNLEPGAAVVDAMAGDSAISSVSWCEVYGKLRIRGVESASLTANMAELGVAILSFDEQDARAAGELAPRTRGAGLSLADRACLALASRLGVPAVTADRAWADLDVGVDIRCVR